MHARYQRLTTRLLLSLTLMQGCRHAQTFIHPPTTYREAPSLTAANVPRATSGQQAFSQHPVSQPTVLMEAVSSPPKGSAKTPEIASEKPIRSTGISHQGFLGTSYPGAQGHEVSFQEKSGKWRAEVKDGWGRTRTLPVLCARDRTPNAPTYTT